MGKIVYCRSQSPDSSSFLDVDCAGKEHPDMRSYQAFKLRYILVDVASAGLVLAYKKLIHSSASCITLGASSAKVYAFRVCSQSLGADAFRYKV